MENKDLYHDLYTRYSNGNSKYSNKHTLTKYLRENK